MWGLVWDGGLTADAYLADTPRSKCGSWLACDGDLTGDTVYTEYISIPAVTATYGSAFTASPFKVFSSWQP